MKTLIEILIHVSPYVFMLFTVLFIANIIYRAKEDKTRNLHTYRLNAIKYKRL